MIVVVGQPLYRQSDAGPVVDGLPARIALEAAARGRSVQLVGKTGEDPAGDAVVHALARGGVGHVALLREAGRPTPRASAIDTAAILEATDVDLALRYLTECSVLVLADPAPLDLVRVVVAAAGWTGSALIVVNRAGEPAAPDLPGDAIVFEAPWADPDGVFAMMLGAFAAALDAGEDPADAFRSSVASGGWTSASAEPGGD